jgi:hypothetical protein
MDQRHRRIYRRRVLPVKHLPEPLTAIAALKLWDALALTARLSRAGRERLASLG